MNIGRESADAWMRVFKSDFSASSIIDRAARRCCGSSALSTRGMGWLLGILTALSLPQQAAADDRTFSHASEFESALWDIVNTGNGNSTLSYDGSATASLNLSRDITLPGSNGSLNVVLPAAGMVIGAQQDSRLTVGRNSLLILGGADSPIDVFLGAKGTTGALVIDGGTVSLASKGTDAIAVGYGMDEVGRLEIRNGGVLDFRSSAANPEYDQLFVGYVNGTGSSPGSGTVVLDGGSILFGRQGASMRFGMHADAEIVLRNGALIDSSLGASHFRVGEYSGGKATVLVEDSSIIIKGGGTGEDIDQRYFIVGYDGGHGTFTQRGNSFVHLSGLMHIGIGQGAGSYGEYNLDGGFLEVGREDVRTKFQVGAGNSSNTSEAHFNVSGGEAHLWGDLEIVNQGGTGVIDVSNGKVAVDGNVIFGKGESTFTLRGGTVQAGGIVFKDGNVTGRGNSTINLYGGVLQIGGTITSIANSSFNFNGGTLRASADADLELAHDAAIGTGGAVFDSNGRLLTVSSALSGEGGVVKVGEGRLVLSGANTYRGGTVVRGGELEVTDDKSLGDVAAAVALDGGTLMLAGVSELRHDLVAGNNGGTIDIGGDTRLTGSGTGTGNVTFTGGRLLLAGKLAWSGETIIDSDATLSVAAEGALSSASTLRLNKGARFDLASAQTIGGLAGAGTINFTPMGRLIIGANNADTTFEGTFNGGGPLTKSGTGRLNLTGDNSKFLGSFVVEQGLLAVNGDFSQSQVEIGANGRLGGVGTVRSIRGVEGQTGGVIAPGNSIGTLTVQGDLDLSGLILEAEVDTDGNSDVLTVLGTAYLKGGTLRIDSGSQVFEPSKPYSFMRAASVEGSFTSVVHDFTFMDADIVIDENGEIRIVMERNTVDFSSAARTANQKAVAAGIGEVGKTNPLYVGLLQLNEQSAPTAFDALSGEIHASAKSALVEDTRHVRAAALDRLRSGAAEASANAAYNVWAKGFGTDGSLKGNGNAAGLDRSIGGILGGVDGVFDGWTLGFLAGYSHSSFDVDARTSSGKADTFHFGAYGGNRWNGLGIRGGLAYAWSNVETNRAVGFGGLGEKLTADYNAGALHAFGEVGYQLDMGGATFEPFANLAHIHLRTHGYDEKGGATALSAGARSMDTTFLTLGLHASSTFDVSGISVTARGTVGWQHAFGDVEPAATHRLAFGNDFTVTGAPVAKNAAVVEAGLDFSITPDASLNVSYSGAFGNGNREHGGRIGLNVKF